MLKRIFIMLAVALAFTIPSQAISIQELKSSPQFKVMYEVTPDVPNANEHYMVFRYEIHRDIRVCTTYV